MKTIFLNSLFSAFVLLLIFSCNPNEDSAEIVIDSNPSAFVILKKSDGSIVTSVPSDLVGKIYQDIKEANGLEMASRFENTYSIETGRIKLTTDQAQNILKAKEMMNVSSTDNRVPFNLFISTSFRNKKNSYSNQETILTVDPSSWLIHYITHYRSKGSNDHRVWGYRWDILTSYGNPTGGQYMSDNYLVKMRSYTSYDNQWTNWLYPINQSVVMGIQSDNLFAMQIEMETNPVDGKKLFDLFYYKVYTSGWGPWAGNGQVAGSTTNPAKIRGIEYQMYYYI